MCLSCKQVYNVVAFSKLVAHAKQQVGEGWCSALRAARKNAGRSDVSLTALYTRGIIWRRIVVVLKL